MKAAIRATLAISVLLATAAQADTWGPVQSETAVADGGDAQVTVTPAAIWPPQPADVDPRLALPRARVERRHGAGWETVWEGLLVNEVTPVDVVVAPGGRFLVTFDNWGSSGYGDNVVVIYDARGTVVRAFRLDELLSPEHVEVMPRSVSSLWWRGTPRISVDGARVLVPVAVPVAGRPLPVWGPLAVRQVEIGIDLATGTLGPDSGEFRRARATIGMAAWWQRATEAARRRWFREPLRAPTGNDLDAWQDYLREAYFRLDPAWNDEWPSIVAVDPRTPDARSEEMRKLRDGIAHVDAALVLGSPDPDLLRDILVDYFTGVGAGGLPGLRVYVAIDAARGAEIAAAMAHTGATYVQVDPAVAIPQRRERITASQVHGARRISR